MPCHRERSALPARSTSRSSTSMRSRRRTKRRADLPAKRAPALPGVVRLAIDTDEELRALFGGTDEGAIGYIATLMAATSHVYTRDVNTRIVVSYLRLWSTEDPWDQAGTGDQLHQFRDHWEAQMEDIDRDLAHFLSGRGLGGGVAWLGVVCNPDWGYALSANLGSNFPYPMENNNPQNWDLMVFMHELGHNFGTRTPTISTPSTTTARTGTARSHPMRRS